MYVWCCTRLRGSGEDDGVNEKDLDPAVYSGEVDNTGHAVYAGEDVVAKHTSIRDTFCKVDTCLCQTAVCYMQRHIDLFL